MAPNPRVKKAFMAMKSMGIPEQKTKPALKKLLKLFDKNWDLIEEENYRVLADTIFELEDTEVAIEKEKKTPETTDRREQDESQHEEPERPLKRLRLKHQGQASNVEPSPSSGTALKVPKPEPGEPDVSPHVSSQPVARNKGKQPMPNSSDPVNVRDKRAAPERASQALQIKEPKVEPGVDPSGKNKKPAIAALIKVKDEPFTDDMITVQPLAVVLPERPNSETCPTDNAPGDKVDNQQPEGSKSVDGVDKGAGKLASPIAEENHTKEADVPAKDPVSIEIAASRLGEVKICLSCSPSPNSRDFHVPDLQAVFKKVEDNCIKTYKVMNPKFTVKKIMKEICERVLELQTDSDGLTQGRSCPEDDRVFNNKGTCNVSSSLNGSMDAVSSDNIATAIDTAVMDTSNPLSGSDCQQMCMQPNKIAGDNQFAERDVCSSVDTNVKSSVVQEQLDHDAIQSVYDMSDITRGQEGLKVSLDNSNCERLPTFLYIAQNVVSHNADVKFSLAQIGNQDCCVSCHGDCFITSPSCNCAQRNGGECPYTSDGLLREEFLEEYISIVRNPKHHLIYCKECPLERLKNEDMLDPCKGHLKRKLVKECWIKCGCTRHCENRVVQRGLRCNLQVFWTPEGKGWGLRTLEDLPKGAFVCEYVGEILTITELQKRILRRNNDKHSYSIVLDTEWGSKALKEKEVLCLDATFYGNVARFINHRCADANLIEIPVEVETPKHYYYHVALFTTRKINAFEELTWDYGVDFDDSEHHIKSFRCRCGSQFCRNMKRSSRSRSALTLR